MHCNEVRPVATGLEFGNALIGGSAAVALLTLHLAPSWDARLCERASGTLPLRKFNCKKTLATHPAEMRLCSLAAGKRLA